MKLRKTSAAVFVALMAVGAGAQAAQIMSLDGGGTFQFTGDPTVYNWTSPAPWPMDTAAVLVPNAFTFSGSVVGFQAVGSGLTGDDSGGGSFDFTNFEILYGGSPIALSNVAVTVNSIDTSAKTFDISWVGSPPFPFPGANFTMTGDYTVVPIPAAAWLFGSAVLGVAGFSRRRKQQLEDSVAA